MTFQVGAKCTKSQTAIKRCKLGEVTIPTASHCCFRRHITTKIGAFMKYFLSTTGVSHSTFFSFPIFSYFANIWSECCSCAVLIFPHCRPCITPKKRELTIIRNRRFHCKSSLSRDGIGLSYILASCLEEISI